VTRITPQQIRQIIFLVGGEEHALLSSMRKMAGNRRLSQEVQRMPNENWALGIVTAQNEAEIAEIVELPNLPEWPQPGRKIICSFNGHCLYNHTCPCASAAYGFQPANDGNSAA
jgi:hypothetical protein